MNARNWLFGAIATVCWFLGSSVPASCGTDARSGSGGATPVAAAEIHHNELIVLVLTKNADGVDAPVNDASVTLFVGEDAKQRVTETDGKVTFPMPEEREASGAECLS